MGQSTTTGVPEVYTFPPARTPSAALRNRGLEPLPRRCAAVEHCTDEHLNVHRLVPPPRAVSFATPSRYVPRRCSSIARHADSCGPGCTRLKRRAAAHRVRQRANVGSTPGGSWPASFDRSPSTCVTRTATLRTSPGSRPFLAPRSLPRNPRSPSSPSSTPSCFFRCRFGRRPR